MIHLASVVDISYDLISRYTYLLFLFLGGGGGEEK